jgi:hypothetical protein
VNQVSLVNVKLDQDKAHKVLILFQIDLMHDRNPEVQKLCDATLDIISLHDESWRDRVRREKFRFHNAQWLEIVEGQRAAQVIQITNHQTFTVGFIRVGSGRYG